MDDPLLEEAEAVLRTLPPRKEIRRVPTCPQCESGNVVPIVYGYMDPTRPRRDSGECVWGGCSMDFERNVHCKSCGHQWFGVTDAPAE
jgi:hypothetical protein